MRKRKISKSEDLSKNEGQSDDKESTNSGVMTRRKHSQCRVIPLSGERSKIDEGTFHKHLENIWKSFSEDKRAAFGQLDSLYFRMYQYQDKRTHALEQIKRENIFSKNYVFVPIVCWDHWRLVIFCHFGQAARTKTRTRCILLLDSAEMCANLIGPDLRKFVFDIFKAEGRPESKNVISRIPLLVPKVPQQKNDVDCGRFVLYFIKLFMETAPENFSRTNGYPYSMTSDWFGPESFAKFCDKLDEDVPKPNPNPNPGVKQVPKRCSQRIRNTRAPARKNSRQIKEVITVDDSDAPSSEEK